MKVKATFFLLAGALFLIGGGTAAADTLGSPVPAPAAASAPAHGETDEDTGTEDDTDDPGTPTDGTEGDVTWGS